AAQRDPKASAVALSRGEIVLPDGFAGQSAKQLLGRDIVVLHTPIERVTTGKNGEQARHGGEPEELRFTVTAVHDDSMGNLDGPGTQSCPRTRTSCPASGDTPRSLAREAVRLSALCSVARGTHVLPICPSDVATGVSQHLRQ
ncbi:hypothetical protein, partial [Streptomyces durbertensis]|uniref:hypothetical protein n=1 Tax=Streptomyces durbertensis TaxID=2448886 RepID=UPI001E3161AF